MATRPRGVIVTVIILVASVVNCAASLPAAAAAAAADIGKFGPICRIYREDKNLSRC